METAHCPKCEVAIPVDNLTLHALRCSGKPTERPQAAAAEPPPPDVQPVPHEVHSFTPQPDLPDSRSAALPDDVVDVDGPSLWACPNCTFENAPADFVCDICATPRLGVSSLAAAAARQAASAPLLGPASPRGELLGRLDGGDGRSGGGGQMMQADFDEVLRAELAEAELGSSLAFRRRPPGGCSPWMPCCLLLASLALTSAALTLLALGDNLAYPGGVVAFVIVAFAAGCTGSWGCVACRRLVLSRQQPSMLRPDLRNLSPEALLLLRQMMELEAADAESLPARPGAIAYLPTHAVSAEELSSAPPEHRSCTICMEEFNQGDTQKTLPCFHRFHAGCIDQWLRQQGTCPICKHRADAGLTA